MADQHGMSKQINANVTPMPKLETKLKTITGLLCDNVYDHLVYTVQENSSGQQYRMKLREFLKTKQDEFFNSYIHTKYKPN